MNTVPEFKPAVLESSKHTRTSTGDTSVALRAVAAHLYGIVYRARNDTGWSFEYLSGDCRSLMGFAPEDLLHNRRMSFESLIYPDDRPGVREQRAAALECNQNYEIEYRIYGADGLLRWISDRGARQPGWHANGSVMVEGVILDITARKLADLAAREPLRMAATWKPIRRSRASTASIRPTS
jgi:PAS domain-containing protein